MSEEHIDEPPFREWAEKIADKQYDGLAAKLEEKMREAFRFGARRARKKLLNDDSRPLLVCDPETNRYSVVLDGVEVYGDLDPFGKRALIRVDAEIAAKRAGMTLTNMNHVLPSVPGSMLPMTSKVRSE
jgi:hypothetical protein